MVVFADQKVHVLGRGHRAMEAVVAGELAVDVEPDPAAGAVHGREMQPAVLGESYVGIAHVPLAADGHVQPEEPRFVEPEEEE